MSNAVTRARKPWLSSPPAPIPFLEERTNVFRKRKKLVNVPQPKSRAELEAQFGRTWDMAELARDFIITAIIAPHVVVCRKADDAVGTLKYQQGPPCLYFSFTQQPSDG